MIRAGLILLVVSVSISANAAETQPATAPAKTASDHSKQFHQVYREGFQPPAEAIDEAQRMRELIDKINRTSLPDYQPEPLTQRMKLKTPAETKTPTTQPMKTLDTPPEVLSTQTLKELAQRVPESVADPIRLGDALYRSGHSDQALFIYQNALEDTQDPEDQVWLYYQMGCCLKDTKPAEARKYYQQVRTIAPDSPWAELAGIQLQLVDWMERNQPVQFLDDIQRDLKIKDERIEESKQAQPRTGENGQTTGSGTLGSSAAATPAGKKQPAPAPVQTVTVNPSAVSKVAK